MFRLKMLGVACALVLLWAAPSHAQSASAQQQDPGGHQDHQDHQAQTAPDRSSGDSGGHQHSGMMSGGQMMAKMDAMKKQTAELQALVDRMNEAEGDAQIALIAQILTTMVQQQTAMHDSMMQMHEHMMSMHGR